MTPNYALPNFDGRYAVGAEEKLLKLHPVIRAFAVQASNLRIVKLRGATTLWERMKKLSGLSGGYPYQKQGTRLTGLH